MVLDFLVAHLGLRTHTLLFEEIVNIMTKFHHPEKAQCYEEVANHSQRIITLIQNNILGVFLCL